MRAARPEGRENTGGQHRERRFGAQANSSARVGCSEAIGEGEMETLRASLGAGSRCWEGKWLCEPSLVSSVGVGVRGTLG